MLDQLSSQTKGLIETVKPFQSWQGCFIKDWTVKFEMLNMGDLMDISNLTAGFSSVELMYASKVYLLAKSIKAINGQDVITTEEVEEYNKSHDLTGKDARNIFELKVLKIKQFSEIVVNRLVFMYDEIQSKYLSQLLGHPLPEELKPTYDGVNLSTIGEQSNADPAATSGATPTTE